MFVGTNVGVGIAVGMDVGVLGIGVGGINVGKENVGGADATSGAAAEHPTTMKRSASPSREQTCFTKSYS